MQTFFIIFHLEEPYDYPFLDKNKIFLSFSSSMTKFLISY